MTITPFLLTVTLLGGWVPIGVFVALTVGTTVVGVHLLSRTHPSPRRDDRGVVSDLAEFAAFRSALRPAIAPSRVDDRPSVVLRPTGSDPAQR